MPLRAMSVARAIERIGDNAVDIGEQTAYLVTAAFREFTDASHPLLTRAPTAAASRRRSPPRARGARAGGPPGPRAPSPRMCARPGCRRDRDRRRLTPPLQKDGHAPVILLEPVDHRPEPRVDPAELGEERRPRAGDGGARTGSSAGSLRADARAVRPSQRPDLTDHALGGRAVEDLDGEPLDGREILAEEAVDPQESLRAPRPAALPAAPRCRPRPRLRQLHRLLEDGPSSGGSARRPGAQGAPAEPAPRRVESPGTDALPSRRGRCGGPDLLAARAHRDGSRRCGAPRGAGGSRYRAPTAAIRP